MIKELPSILLSVILLPELFQMFSGKIAEKIGKSIDKAI